MLVFAQCNRTDCLAKADFVRLNFKNKTGGMPMFWGIIVPKSILYLAFWGLLRLSLKAQFVAGAQASLEARI